MQKNKMSLRGKVVGLVFASLLVSAIVNVYAFFALNNDIIKYQDVAEVQVPNLINIYEMHLETEAIKATINKLIGSNTTAEDSKKATESFEHFYKAYSEFAAKYEALPFAPGEMEMWNDLKNNGISPFFEASKKIIALSAGTKEDQIKRDLFAESEFKKIDSDRDVRFEKLIEFVNKNVNSSNAEAKNDALFLKWFIPLLSGIVFLIAMAVSFLFATSFMKQIREMILNLNQVSNEIATESQSLSTASTQLASTTSEQSSAVQETSASVEEIKATAGKNSEMSKNSSMEAVDLKEQAVKGSEVAQTLVHSMQDITESNAKISEAVSKSNSGLDRIVGMINEISNKTMVINEIVFQTKLLSFNASVEAARAGEHGKGFAVVAEEVGNLAQMSGNASKEISSLLESSVNEVKKIAKESTDETSSLLEISKEKLSIGETAVQNTFKTFNEMSDKLGAIVNNASQISRSSEEQVSGISQIAEAMENLSSATHQISSVSESTSHAANILETHGEKLKSLTSDLELIVIGTTQNNPTPNAKSEKRNLNTEQAINKQEHAA